MAKAAAPSLPEAVATVRGSIESGELMDHLRQHHHHLSDGEFALMVNRLLAMLADIEGMLKVLSER